MKRRIVRGSVLLVLVGLVSGLSFRALCAGEAAMSAGIELSSGQSIQAAIDGAAPGSVISLGPGVFRGSLVIDRSVTLRGADEGSVIEGSRFGAAVRIIGDTTRVLLEQLTVTGGQAFNGHGIQTEDAATVEMIGVTSAGNNWCGIWATGRSTLVLTDCRLIENRTFGLYTWDFAHVELRGCTISGNETHGIYALHVSEITLIDSRIVDNWSGLWAWDGVRLHATNTEIGGAETHGVVAQNAALIALDWCTVTSNGGCGLWFCESSRGVLSDCLIASNGEDGVLIEQDGIVEFYRCVVRGNEAAGIRTGAPECVGGFDPANPYKGWVKGIENTVPGPDRRDGNRQVALCPAYPGSLWPPGFLAVEAESE